MQYCSNQLELVVISKNGSRHSVWYMRSSILLQIHLALMRFLSLHILNFANKKSHGAIVLMSKIKNYNVPLFLGF